MKDLSRRDFIARGAALSAALPLGAVSPLRAAAQPVGEGGAREAAVLAPVTVFSKHLQWLDYSELADIVAEAGFDGIDLTVRPGGHVEPDRVTEDLPRAVRAARAAGLAVPMMTTAITSARDPGARRILGTARAEGIDFYRMGSLRYPARGELFDSLQEMRPLLRELAAMNERYEIHGGYQNHSGVGVGGPVWDLGILLEGIDPRWLGVQYDIAHATVEGGTAWPLGLQLLSPYIRTLDMKDFLWAQREDRWVPRWVPLGEGMVNYRRYLEMIRQLRLSGPVSVHYEYEPLLGPSELAAPERRKQAVELMKRDLQRLRTLLREAEL